MTNPCYKCENRQQGCHAECKAYAEWSANHKQQKAKSKKHAEATDFLIDSIFKTKRRKT